MLPYLLQNLLHCLQICVNVNQWYQTGKEVLLKKKKKKTVLIIESKAHDFCFLWFVLWWLKVINYLQAACCSHAFFLMGKKFQEKPILILIITLSPEGYRTELSSYLCVFSLWSDIWHARQRKGVSSAVPSWQLKQELATWVTCKSTLDDS